MVIEQTVEIPADKEIDCLHLEVPMPKEHPSGRIRVAVILTPESPRADDVSEADIDAEISVRPPDFDEFYRLCDLAKKLNIPNLYNCDEILEEAARYADGKQALEYRRGAKKIRYWLSHRELWDEATRSIRNTREEWEDPWQAQEQKAAR